MRKQPPRGPERLPLARLGVFSTRYCPRELISGGRRTDSFRRLSGVNVSCGPRNSANFREELDFSTVCLQCSCKPRDDSMPWSRSTRDRSSGTHGQEGEEP